MKAFRPHSVHVPRLARSALRVQASSGKDGKMNKEEAARKALQDALKGVNNNKDILASFDGKPPAGGAGGGGGGINIKKVVGDFGDEFRKKTIGFFKAVTAILVFGGVLLLFQFWNPFIAFCQMAIVKLFRLDSPSARLAGAGRMRSPQQAEAERALAARRMQQEGSNVLGGSEASVVSKWSGDDEGEDE